MNILQRILTGGRPDTRAIAKPRPEKSLVQQVWEAPALFNRRMRRAAGLLSKYWRWDLNATAETRRVYTPRYIRRHFDAGIPRTRRQRKARARVLRIVERTRLGT